MQLRELHLFEPKHPVKVLQGLLEEVERSLFFVLVLSDVEGDDFGIDSTTLIKVVGVSKFQVVHPLPVFLTKPISVSKEET